MCLSPSLAAPLSICLLAYPRCTGFDNNKHRHTIIGYTSASAGFAHCFVSWPCVLQLGRQRLTGAKPHAVFLPANITGLYLHLSPPKTLLFSTQNRTFCSCIPNRGSCYMLFSHHISFYNLGPVPKNMKIKYASYKRI